MSKFTNTWQRRFYTLGYALFICLLRIVAGNRVDEAIASPAAAAMVGIGVVYLWNNVTKVNGRPVLRSDRNAYYWLTFLLYGMLAGIAIMLAAAIWKGDISLS